MSKTPIPRNIQAEVFQRDGFRCRYCGDTSGPFELDHVYPEARGGQTTTDNLVVACKACNRLKYDSVGMWPFPIGHFEASNISVPEGNGRYWSYLVASIKIINQTILSYKDIKTGYGELATGLGNKKDNDNYLRATAYSLFGLCDMIRNVIDELEHIHHNLTHIFPSAIKSFILMITGQVPPITDLMAVYSVLDKIASETEHIQEESRKILTPFLQYGMENNAIILINYLTRPLDQLESCAGSIVSAKNLLYQAQLSIKSERIIGGYGERST